MGNELIGLNWVGRAINSHSDKKIDVSITVANQSNTTKKKCVNFTFRNGIEKLITDTEYILVAPYKSRVFFKKATDVDGITLLKNKNSSNSTYARISAENDVPKFEGYAGNYQLKYDEFYELYYVEKEGN